MGREGELLPVPVRRLGSRGTRRCLYVDPNRTQHIGQRHPLVLEAGCEAHRAWREVFQEEIQCDFRFQPCERCVHAEVLPEPERQVRSGARALEGEDLGVPVDALVPVRRSETHDDALAGRVKNQIFWDNGAELYGLGDASSAAALDLDAIEEMSGNYRSAGIARSNRRYGYVHAG